MSRKVILFKKKSIKFLVQNIKTFSGRNNTGKIVVRGRGLSVNNKKSIRTIDFNRNIWNIMGIVLRIEYDPYRTAFIALVSYTNSILTYVICPDRLLPGDFILTSEVVPITYGNSTILKNIPIQEKVYNIEKYPFSGAYYVKSAGCFATIIEKTDKKCCILLPSKTKIWVSLFCLASIGLVSNAKHKFNKLTKAGQNRLRGLRPKVRGVAMNAKDHPHGGGKGKKSPNSISSSPWGKLGKGKSTSKKK